MLDIRNNYERCKEWVTGSPDEIEPERPGEIFSGARRELPRLIAKLSIGIVGVGAFRMPWVFVAILAILYVCVHGLSKIFARYMEHGASRLSYPMTICVCALIGWQVVTLGGQATMEVIYRMKVDEDAEYQRKVAAHSGVVAQFQAEEKTREDAWKEREKGRQEREKLRLAGNEQSNRRARTLLTLSRENKGVKVSGSIAAEETPAEAPEVFIPRPLPVLEPGPTETAPQFLTKWALVLKIWQLLEFGVALLGLASLALLRISLNRKGREMLVAVQDRELLPLVTTTRETLQMLPEWRTPVPPSLPVVEVETAVIQPKTAIEESGEGAFSQKLDEPPSLVEIVRLCETPCEMEPVIVESETAICLEVEALEDCEKSAADCATLRDESATEVAAVEPLAIAIPEPEILGIVEIADCEKVAQSLSDEPEVCEKSESLNETAESAQSKDPFLLCDGAYRLTQKLKAGKPAGFDLRRVSPKEKERRDIGYLGQSRGENLVNASPTEQVKLVAAIIADKERPVPEPRALGQLEMVKTQRATA